MDAFTPAQLTGQALAVWFLVKGLAQIEKVRPIGQWSGLVKWGLAYVVSYALLAIPGAELFIAAASLSGAAGIIKPLAELAKNGRKPEGE